MGNLDTWNRFNKPPITALKKISGGRMNNKTDINPVWRMQVMTEAFGPCGIGWRYTIDKLWLEPGTEEQVCAFALVTVFVKQGDSWSEPIPGIGGSMLVEKTKSGPYTSDEAYKMAVTDALSVAFKSLGVAAEIYLGNFDGSKYLNQPKEPAPDISGLINKYYTECDSYTTIDGLIKWWETSGDKIKKDIGIAEAAKLFSHFKENKTILKDDLKKESTPEDSNNDPAI